MAVTSCYCFSFPPLPWHGQPLPVSVLLIHLFGFLKIPHVSEIIQSDLCHLL